MNNPFGGQQAAPQGQQQANPFGGPPAGNQQRPAGQGGGGQEPTLRSLDEAVGGSGAPSLFKKDSPINHSGGGTIIDAVVRQIRDFVTKQPKTWDDGRPQEQVVVRVQTELRDTPDDDGVRGIYVKTWGPQVKALQEAISAAGFQTATAALAPGNQFFAQLTGTQPSQGGDPEKLYRYHIQPGAAPQQAAQQAPPAQQQTFPAASGGTQERPPF